MPTESKRSRGYREDGDNTSGAWKRRNDPEESRAVLEGEAVLRLYVLVEKRFQPVPPTVRVEQQYGEETVVVGDPTKSGPPESMTRGDIMLLSGTEQAFKDWLRPFDGFWTTRNPMMGKWTVRHVGDGLEVKRA